MPDADSAPCFVLSLDFELRWGRYDRLGLDPAARRDEIEGEREAVPLLLDVFTERGLHATWATVGAVACRNWDDYFSRAASPPHYANRTLRIEPSYAGVDPDGRLHFAPDLVDRIANTRHQELGTHTFSHLLCREPGVTADDVAADLTAVSRLWRERWGSPPRSLVFPRNQAAFPDVVRACGIRVWRGTPRRWCYGRNEASTNGRVTRLFRLLEDLTPWARHAQPLVDDVTVGSVFLRLDLPAVAWRLQVAHARRELARIRPGETFHVWWHPHNLGSRPGLRLGRVREMLDLVADHVARGTIRSCNMGELVP